MRFPRLMLAGLALACAPLAATAEAMSYNWVDAEYVDLDIDDAPSGDGYAAQGSVGFGEYGFAFAEYNALSVDVVDIDLWTVGLGGHYPINPDLDVVGRAGYLKIDISVPGGGLDDDGYLVSLGLRGRLGGHVELEGSVMARDTGNDSETVWVAGGRYHFNRNFAVGAEYQVGDNANLLYAGLRFSF